MKEALWVFLGGGLGSVLRYLISKTMPKHLYLFPWHTLLVNTLGCFLIGLLMGCLTKHPTHWLPLLLVTGFCGGFTTFSTFSFEALHLFKLGEIWLTVAYVIASLLLCLLFVFLGYWLGQKI